MKTLFKNLIRSPLLCACLLISLICAMLVIPGCSSAEVDKAVAEAKAAIPQVQAEVEKTKTALTETQVQIAAEKAAGKDTAAAEKVAAQMQKALDVALATLERLNRVVSAGDSTAAIAEAAIKELSPLVPGGFGPLIGLGLTTILALNRARQNRDAARNMAIAIEKAKDDGKVDFKNPDTAAAISTRMGAMANRIVDEAQGKVKPLPV